MMAATLIECTFLNDSATWVPVKTHFSDDLPDHVKGGMFWNLTKQCYYMAVDGTMGPVEFINDVWYAIIRNSDNRTVTCMNVAIMSEENREIGWWRANDAQHLNNRAMSAPREPPAHNNNDSTTIAEPTPPNNSTSPLITLL
jgi:hypothetical protein